MPSITLITLITLISLSLLPSTVSAQTLHSHAMAQECRGVEANSPANREKAEQWVRQRLKAFLPNTRDQALRMRLLEQQAEQVKLAFYGISSTCEQYRAGKMTQNDADLSLSGFEDTIANFIHDLGNQAVATAGRGQVSDMESIRKALTDMGGTARQAALLGEEELAMESWHKMTDAVVSFSRTFVESCYDQSFDPRIALSMERQNEMLGTGIDLTPCAKRKFTAEGKGADILWLFEHCGQGSGEWKITTSGPLQGKGVGTVDPTLSGSWYVDESTSEKDVKVVYSGTLSITTKPISGDPDFKEPDQLMLDATHYVASASGEVSEHDIHISGLSFTTKKSDKPCRNNDD
jgi:hypothetical protein